METNTTLDNLKNISELSWSFKIELEKKHNPAHGIYLYINVDNIINVYCENVFEISIDLSHVLRKID